MQVFDASSMIHAWDNYPEPQFPGLWDWMAEQIEEKELVIPKVAFEEIAYKTPDCGEWLTKCEVVLLGVNNKILQNALQIKQLLGVVGDGYHPKGVGENDILIISTARVHGSDLISNEGRQKRPEILAKSKIPHVCAMPQVSVPCLNFVEYLRRSEAVFR